MARVKKYEIGARFIDPNDLYLHIAAGLYLWETHNGTCGRPVHPSWIGSQPWFLVIRRTRAGTLTKAKITAAWQVKHQPQLKDIAA